MCFHDSSETCTRPSTPPRSTKAPKLTTEDTTPLRTWPRASWLRNSLRTSDCVCSSQARRDRTTLAVLVQFDDLGLDLAADVGCRSRTRRISTSEAGRKPRNPVQDQAALDDLDDRALDGLVGLLEGLDRAPRALRALLGQDQPALLVLLLENEGLDELANRHDLGGVDVVLDRELARG